jgi:hypothetical protein
MVAAGAFGGRLGAPTDGGRGRRDLRTRIY